ncbi:MAG: hypothetical protein FWC55_09430, partial [Firmicutes bacterium]|nr:hypothetical protein [Bacillota bacterium]
LNVMFYGTKVPEWNDNHQNMVQTAIKQATGVTLQFDDPDEDQFAVYLNSGTLPDMLRLEPQKYGEGLVTGGKLVALDDMLPTLGQDMLKSIPDTLKYSAKNWSFNTGKTFFVPVNVGPDLMGAENDMGAIVRWDYYKELGYPEIKGVDDFLNVLKQMQTAHPKTEDGKTVYGVGLFNDMGGWIYNMTQFFFTGMGIAANSFAGANNDYSKCVTVMDDSHPMWSAAEFLFKANQMGLLDPDAFTMTYADLDAKMTNGQILSSNQNWTVGKFNAAHANLTDASGAYAGGDGKGYMSVPIIGGRVWHGNNSPLGWANKCFCITTSCSNPEAAMRVLNYMWSYDGTRVMYSGLEGQTWNYSNKVPTLTGDALNNYKDPAWKASTGVSYDYNIIGLAPTTTHPDGYPVSLFNSAQVMSMNLSPLFKDFADHYGVSYPGEYWSKLVADGVMKNNSDQNAYVNAYPRVLTDEESLVLTNLNNLQLQWMPRLALAKDQAEFDSLKEQAKGEFDAAGAQSDYDSFMKWLAAAQADAAQYTK